MEITYKLDAEATEILHLMAREAELSLAEMTAVAVFNLIAIYLGQHGTIEQEESATGPEIRKSPL